MCQTVVIGVGAFGRKRARSVQESSLGKLYGVADIDAEQTRKLAQKLGVKALCVDEVFEQPIDVVIIATPNKFHEPLSIRAFEAGMHVHVEKPLSINAQQAVNMVQAATKAGKFLKMGSNHRYFASVMRAHEICKNGEIGNLISFNGRIGNNGERIQGSWFWNPELSGGGTLLDNGCHLLDLARLFLGDFSTATGAVSNVFWKTCAVEDTASCIFTTEDGRMASITSSWRQMAGYIHFEINGTEGYVTVDGRFDTHGGDKLFWKGKGNGLIRSEDFGHVRPRSYVLELDDFYQAIQENRQPEPSGHDGIKVMRMIDAVYESNNHKVML